MPWVCYFPCLKEYNVVAKTKLSIKYAHSRSQVWRMLEMRNIRQSRRCRYGLNNKLLSHELIGPVQERPSIAAVTRH